MGKREVEVLQRQLGADDVPVEEPKRLEEQLLAGLVPMKDGYDDRGRGQGGVPHRTGHRGNVRQAGFASI
jgi:hypothetical protein